MSSNTNALLLLILNCVIYKSRCFNLDLNFVDILKSDSERNYFGYSVLLQKGASGTSVIVGAPKSNSTLHPEIIEPGALFRCELSRQNSCEEYLVDDHGNSEQGFGSGRFAYNSKRDYGFLGAAIDGEENAGDKIFVCSPKWINNRSDRNGQHHLLNGICYLIKNSTNLQEAGVKLMPLLNAGKQGYTVNGVAKYYYAMGQAGMSMQYLSDHKELILGAPGVLSWSGTTIKFSTLPTTVLPSQYRSESQRRKRQIETSVITPNPIYNAHIPEENSYFGYSISSGKFTNGGSIWYVAGAPRGRDLKGVVLLYEFPEVEYKSIQVHKSLVGEQLGCYFGASVLGVDITNNGVSDLFVGAPTYSTNYWDEGCVYLYENDGQGNFDSPLILFGSQQKGGRFGTAISGIGDINQDSYQDVAISAPYEDEQGVVYIFMGRVNGLSPMYSQRIVAKTVDSSLRGFGFSLSKGLDIDHNFYNDVAIGAYKSGHVTIIKSRPVIRYWATLKSSMKELSVNTSDFNITYCIKFNSTGESPKTVETKVLLTQDSRIINKDGFNESILLDNNLETCEAVEITLTTGSLDYSKSLTIEIAYEVQNKNTTEFCGSCPVTDPSAINSITLNVPFANGCGFDNLCQPDLKIQANFENNMNYLTIGSLSTIKLKVRIINENEPAYLTQIHMKIPSDVEIVRIPSKCELSEDRLYHCLVDNVLQPNTYKEFVFDFDIKKLNPHDKELAVNITVDSRGEEVNSSDNSITIILPLRLESNMEIEGKSFPDQIVYVDEENKINNHELMFNHEYTIKNLGPSPLPQGVVTFYFPVELSIDAQSTSKNPFNIYEPQVFINSQQIQCTTDYHLGFHVDKVDGGETDIDEDGVQTAAVLQRIKRDSYFNEETNFQHQQLSASDALNNLPINRTIFINCTNPSFKCMQIRCITGEVLRNQYIKASFQVKAHVDVLQQTLEKKDLILISTTAGMTVNEKDTKNYITTLLIGTFTVEQVASWIYIVSVLAALIILTIVTFVLYKFNFFNRPVREMLLNSSEMPYVKSQLNDDDHDDEDDDDDEEHEINS